MIQDRDNNLSIVDEPVETRNAIAVIDSRVDDYQGLIRELTGSFRHVVIDRNENAIDVITDALKECGPIGGLVFLAHGQPGGMLLGNRVIDENTIDDNWAQISGWTASLPSQSRVWIYACRSGAGAVGNHFVRKLSDAVSLPVEACTQDVGSAALGGTWELDVVHGVTGSAAHRRALRPTEWVGLLQLPLVGVSASFVDEGTTGTDPNYLSWTLTLSEASSESVTVAYRFLPGTASVSSSSGAGADTYGSLAGTVIFAAGETSKTVFLRIDGDALDEVDESIVLEVYGATGAALAGGVPVVRSTAWILDDDGTGNNLALYTSRPVLVEGDDGQRLASFEVSLSRPAPEAFTVAYTTVDGSAVAGEDYEAVSGTLSFAVGQTTASVTVPVFGDGDIEPTELFALSIDKPAVVEAVSIGEAEILDDDAGGETQPTVNVSSTSTFESTTGTDPNYLSWTLTLSEASSEPVTVAYRFLSGTASVSSSSVAGADAYGTLDSRVVFAAGETSKTVFLRIDGDALDEVDESVVLEVYGATGAALAGGVPVVRSTAWILDDDGTGNNLALYTSRPVLVEGDDGQRLASFEVSLSRPAPEAFTVAYTTVDGSAVAGEDYEAVSGTLSFAVGQTTASVTVPVFGDGDIEPTELFALSIDKPAVVEAVSIGEAEILDDDAGGESLPTVNVTGASTFESTTGNDPNYLSWTLTLSEASSESVTVAYRFLPGTASVSSSSGAGADTYGTLDSRVVFAAGETSKTVFLRIDGDALDEVDESIVLEVYGATGAALAGGVPVVRSTAWILDDDGTGNNLALYTSRPVLIEGDDGQRLASFEVSLSRPAPEAFTVAYTTVDGSAVAGEDYEAVSGTLSFAVGQTTASVTVPVFGDGDIEPTELFALSIDKPAVVEAVSIGEAEILDDDAGGETQPTVNVSSTSTFENTTFADSNNLTWTITLSEPSTEPVLVAYRILPGTAQVSSNGNAGADAYGARVAGVVFAAGETSKTVSFRIDADAVDEVDETVVLELFLAVGAEFAGGAERLRSSGVILDDDGAGEDRALQIDDLELIEGDSGSQQAVFTVRLSRPAETELSFDYQTLDGTATAGTDYLATSGTLTFAAGQTVTTLAVDVLGDTLAENSEHFILKVEPQAQSASAIASELAGHVGQARIIEDDDTEGLPVLSIHDARSLEGTTGFDANFLNFDVVLSEAASEDVLVQWRAVAATAALSDLSVASLTSGTLRIGAGENLGVIDLRLSADAIAEADEAIVVELFEVTGAEFAGGVERLRANGVILDDDGAGENRALLIDDLELIEGDSGSQQAVFTVRLSRPAETELSFDYQTLDGTAIAGTDYLASSGTLTFAAGQTVTTVAVEVLGDALAENSEHFALKVQPQAQSASAIGSELAGHVGQVRIIEDDDAEGLPVLSVRDTRSLEGTGFDPNSLSFDVVLSEAASEDVIVQWRAVAATADLTDQSTASFSSGVLRIGAGESLGVIDLRLSGDAIVEADEAIVLELYEVTGAEFAGGVERLRANGVILDDDGLGENRALLVDDLELVEGDSGSQQVVFTVRLSRPAETDLTFDYQTLNGTAKAGTDYLATSGTLTFAAGQTATTVAVDVLGDTLAENSEHFALRVQPQTQSASAIGSELVGHIGQVRIIEDDDAEGLPVLSIRDARSLEGTGFDPNFLSFDVVLSEAASEDVLVQWRAAAATADLTDLSVASLSSGTLRIGAGDSLGAIHLRLSGDAITEADEAIVLELFEVTGAEFAGGVTILRATGWLLDDDDADNQFALYVAQPVIVEGDSGIREANFEVTLSRPAPEAFSVTYTTVDGSAVAGEDYEATSGTLSFAAGQTIASVTVPVFGDTEIEPTEMFSIEVTRDGVTISSAATIENDDFQNAPVAEPDTYDATVGAVLSVDAAAGVLANDTDDDGDPLSAFLIDGPSKGSVALAEDGSFVYTPEPSALGIDSFTYQAFDGIDLSEAATVTISIQPSTLGELTLDMPDRLAVGEAGAATVSYADFSPALIAVTAERGLLADPASGGYSETVFLLSDGSGSEETLEIDIRGTAGPRSRVDAVAQLADPDAITDLAARYVAYQPDFIDSSIVERIEDNITDQFGTTVLSLTSGLAPFAERLESFGLDGSSASAALAFAFEAAGDFGSIEERGTTGSLGQGWAMLADLGLQIDGTSVQMTGLSDIDALRSLSVDAAALYTVSNSADRSVTLAGDVLALTPPVRPRFEQVRDGSFVTTSAFDGTLSETDDGYALTLPDGDALIFDAAGAFQRLEMTDGLQISASYDGDGNIVALSGPNGEELTFDRRGDGRVVRVEDADGVAATFVYGGAGQLQAVTRPEGQSTFGYGSNGDLTMATAPGGIEAQFVYDALGRLDAASYGGGAQTEDVAYDDLGGVTITDGAGTVTDFDLLPGSIVRRITDAEGGVSEIFYDDAGALAGVRAPDGTETTFEFDGRDRLTKITDANGAELQFAYDGTDEQPASFTDAGGGTRGFTYDAGGRITEATWPDGTELQFDYDAEGNLTGYTNRRSEDVTYTYDVRGRLLSESDSSAGPTTYTYDARGRLTSATNDQGTTALAYDSADRVMQIDYPTGRSLSYTYNEAGLRSSMSDGAGYELFYDYDALGRLTGLRDGSGDLVSYTYDAGGNLVREENGNGTVSLFDYNEAGRVTRIENQAPDGGINSFNAYTYDVAGQRVTNETQDGSWTYGYDAAGQLISADFASINPDIDNKSITYEYDAAGNRTRVVEDGVETLYEANALNQYTSVGEATFTYDDDGNMTSRIDGDGTTTYAYDLDNRLTSVTQADGTVLEFEYDVFGNRVAKMVDGVETAYMVDPFGLGDVIAEFEGGTLSATYSHGLGLASGVIGGQAAFFDADALGSVATVTGSNGEVANVYAYTPFGIELREVEGIANAFEFNGALGVVEDSDELTFMRARSYSDELGRFLSEDPLWLGGDPANLYRFALNAPTKSADPLGLRSDDYFVDPILGRENPILTLPQPNIVNKIGNTVSPVDTIALANAISVARQLESNPNYLDGAYGELNRQIAGEVFSDAAYIVGGPLIGKLLKKFDIKIPFSEALAKKILDDTFFDDPPDSVVPEFDPDAPFDPPVEKNEPEFRDDSGDPGTIDSETADTDASRVDPADGDTRNYGDPHLITFDRTGYSFQAVGEFTMVLGDGFEMQVRMEAINDFASVNTAVAMQVGEDVVAVYARETIPLVANGTAVVLAQGESIAVGDFTLYRTFLGEAEDLADAEYIVTDSSGNGFYVRVFDGNANILPFISDDAPVAGLLGNLDGDHRNDFALRDGTMLSQPLPETVLYGEYADSWRIDGADSLFLYRDGESTETFTDRSFPANIVTLEDLDPTARAEAEVIALAAGLVPGTFIFETTVIDIVLTGNNDFAEAIGEVPEFAPEDQQDEPIIPLEINEAPELPDEPGVNLGPEGSFDIDVLAGVTDPEGDTLTLLGGTDANGGTVEIVEVDGRQILRFTPADGFSGDTEVSFQIGDGQGNVVTGSVTVTITEAPNEPPAANPIDAGTVGEDGVVVSIDLLADASASDSDGGVLDVADVEVKDGNGNAIAFGLSGALLTINPVQFAAALNTGDDLALNITYRVIDGQGGSTPNTGTLMVSGLDGPFIWYQDSDGDGIGVDDEATNQTAYEMPEGTSDVAGDNDDTDGSVFPGAPEINDGKDNDQDGEIDEDNTDPVAVGDSYTVAEDGTLVIPVSSLLANDTDADSDALTVTEVSGAVNGSVVLDDKGDDDATNDEVIFIPDAGFSGDASFNYAISDGFGGSASGAVDVTVTDAPNVPPTATPIDAGTVDEDGAVVSIDLLADASASDSDGGVLDVADVEVKDGDGNAIAFGLADALLTINPAQFAAALNTGDDLTLNITYRVIDGQGGSTPNTGTLMVAGLDGPFIWYQDSDGDGIGVDDEATNQTAYEMPEGTSGVAGDNDDSDDSVFPGAPEINDGKDNDQDGETDEDNRDPVAVGDVYTVAEDDTLVIPVSSLLSNDTDADGDNLTVTGVTGAVNGSVALDDKGDDDAANDEVIFTPDDGFSGDASFNYAISDGFGGNASGAVDVTVTDAPNVPPTATPIDAGTVGEDGTVVSIDLLADASASDSDGGVLDVADVEVKDGDGNAIAFGLDGALLTINPAQFAAVLNTGDNLALNITYRVTDGQGGSTPNTGTLMVAGLDGPFIWYQDSDGDGIGIDDEATNQTAYEMPEGTSEIAGDNDDTDGSVFPGAPEINDGKDNDQDGETDEDNTGPVAIDDIFAVHQDGTLVIPVSSLLANDTDADSDGLTMTGVSGAVNGSVVLDDKGDDDATNDEVIFTPDAGFFGDAEFDYEISDGFGGVATATASVEVTQSISEIVGTSASDYLVGTDGADVIRSLSGSYDRMIGGAGADEFVFGGEAVNGRRERDVILDYEVGIDTIVLTDGASVGAVRQSSGGAVIFLEGDNDAVYVRGEGVTSDNLTIFSDAEFDFG